MTAEAFQRWLDGVAPTRPFTLDDAKELYRMIKDIYPNAYVEVYTTSEDIVRVRVGDPSAGIARNLEIQ